MRDHPMTYLKSHWQLLAIIAVVFALWQTPVVVPLKILVVFLHELSHAVAAWLTGGSVEQISISPAARRVCHYPWRQPVCDSIGGLSGVACDGRGTTNACPPQYRRPLCHCGTGGRHVAGDSPLCARPVCGPVLRHCGIDSIGHGAVPWPRGQ